MLNSCRMGGQSRHIGSPVATIEEAFTAVSLDLLALKPNIVTPNVANRSITFMNDSNGFER
jgi:hypothetical protein